MRVKVLQKIITLIGILLLAYTAIMSITTNFNLGMITLGIFSGMLIVYGLTLHKTKSIKWIQITVILIVLIVIVFSGFLAIYGHNNNSNYDEDVVIVLGAGIHGERVSATLAKRLDVAVEYYQKNSNALIVVSGGQGPQEDISEALAMERYLINKGIPAKQIIKEDKSTSTYENFVFSDKILKEKFSQGYSAVFITNYFHIYRAGLTARFAGVSANHIGAPIIWYTVPVNYVREMMAIVAVWILGITFD